MIMTMMMVMVVFMMMMVVTMVKACTQLTNTSSMGLECRVQVQSFGFWA